MKRWLLAAVMVSAADMSFATQVFRVDAAANPGGDGLSWNTAFSDLSAALAAASVSAPAQVWVARGTYRPDLGSGARGLSFVMASGVGIYGGFAGTESTLTQRDPIANVTVLSGDIGQAGVPDDNSYHVVVAPTGASSSAILDGLTIVGGNASGTGFPLDSGGGLLADGGSPTIRDCTFQLNSAKHGGGLFVRVGSPVIQGCRFSQNIASGDGGGMNVNGSVAISECVFDANRANFGGGLVVCCGTSSVRNSRFTGNFANTGGGVFSPIGTLWVVGCEFEGNSAGTGGAIHSSSTGSTLNVVNCALVGNSATQGGALYLTNAPIVFNSLFSRNTSMQRGGAMYLQGGARITNCTVFSNWSLMQGGGIYAASGIPVVANTILWSNADSQSTVQAGQLSSASGLWSINYSCVHGWTGSIAGVGNVGNPPRFADPSGADRRLGTADDAFLLLPGSSCIDAGDPSVLFADVWDLDADGNTTEIAPLDVAGSKRVIDDPETVDTGPGQGPHVDIGAFERQHVCSADFDGSGWVDVDDYSAFIAAFDEGSSAADYDGSGFVDFQDFDAFIADFSMGC